MKVEFEWKKDFSTLVSEKTGGSDGLLFLANEAARLMDPYVPASQAEVLAQNLAVYQEDDHAVIHYLSPYAHYQWEGKLYVDPITKKGAFTNGGGLFWSRPGVAKKPTDRPLKHKKTVHPLATSHWDKAMMTARKQDLVTSYAAYLERGKA